MYIVFCIPIARSFLTESRPSCRTIVSLLRMFRSTTYIIALSISYRPRDDETCCTHQISLPYDLFNSQVNLGRNGLIGWRYIREAAYFGLTGFNFSGGITNSCNTTHDRCHNKERNSGGFRELESFRLIEAKVLSTWSLNGYHQWMNRKLVRQLLDHSATKHESPVPSQLFYLTL